MYTAPVQPLERYGLKSCREMVVAWFGLYFVSAKCSLAAHKVRLVVPNLAQERHAHHTDLYIPTVLVVHGPIYGVIYAILCHAFCTMHHCQLLR